MKRKLIWAALVAALIMLLGAAALAEDVCPYCGGKLTVGPWEPFGTESHSRAMLCEDCGGECNREYQAHWGGTATCMRGRICEVCGATYGIPDPYAHDYEWQSNGDGTHNVSCSNPGCTYAETNVACSGGTATCTQRAVCSVCNGEYGDLAAHNYANKYKKDEDGTYYRACQNAGCTARDGGYYLYRIIHSGGDGGGLWSSQKYSKEDTCTLSILSNVPTYAGHTFLYWQDDAGKQYTKGDSITLTSASTDIWVRAVYEKIETECDKYGHLFIYAPYFQQHKATCSRCGYETTESHTLNAEQTQCTKCGAYRYSLVFISGFGNPQWGSSTYSAKESCDISITTSVPICSGGTFDHWTDGSGQYRAGDKYTLTAGNPTATLYAVFSHEGACSGDANANCTEYGTCQYCRKPYLDPDNHSFTDKASDELASDATCTEAAKYYVQCDRCGVVSKTETVAVGDPLNHSFTDKASDELASAATCTEAAKYYVQCDRCDEVSDTATVAVGNPLNHSFTNKASDELASVATCTEAAKYYVQCDRCDEVSDTVTVAVGEAKGHVEVTVPGIAPTCTSTGLTAGKRCAVCGEILVKQTGLAMTGHAYKASTIAPTCTEGGYTKYTCANCGAGYTTDETNARGHYYGEWTPSDGAHSALCQRTGCEHTRTVACESFAWRLFAGEAAYDFAFCPVCGEVNDGTHLSWVEEAGAEALTKNLPRGEIVLRVGALANGEAVMSVGFEYSGELTQPAGEVKVTLPAALLEGYTLTLLEADGAESELPFAVEDEEISFTLDFTPVEDEEPVPVRVIRLIPVAG